MMQAVVFKGNGQWKLETLPVPVIQSDTDVLLRVEHASICGTDIHILSVPPGHPATPGSILGHEYVATVEAIGNRVIGLQVGDHVVVDPNITCGQCAYCRMGMSNVCQNMTTLGIFRHGGLAGYNLAPASALHPISKHVPLDHALFAEPLSCVYHGFEKCQVRPGDNVAILGAGPIGLLYLLMFRAAGVGKVFMVEPVDYRREFARKMGADLVLDPTTQDCAEEIRREIGVGVDVAIDAVGSLLPQAMDIARRGGKVLLFGVNQQSQQTLHQYVITRHELTILGSFIQRTAFPQVVRILESGVLPLEKLITHRIGLEQIADGFEAMRTGRCIEVVVTP